MHYIYFLTGEAEVQIRVTDTNDNAPYFRQRIYSAQVPENAEPSAVVIKVTADDRDEDSHLTYSVIDGNVGNAFQVVPDTGVIKVRASLDYETGPRVCCAAGLHLVFSLYSSLHGH